MSIIDGLPTLKAAVSIKDERGEHHAVTNMIAWVKRDDVWEALTNPTDEQRESAGRALRQATRLPSDPEWESLDLGLRRIYEKEACAVLAAAAGGDDE